MTYEQWRITYQSSEQASRAAFETVEQLQKEIQQLKENRVKCFTDTELTHIYKKANNEVGKARPLTTESIFKAMRAMVEEMSKHESP